MELNFFEDNINHVINDLIHYGPVSNENMEFLSQFKFFHPTEFSKYEKEILKLMGLFYKKELFDDDDENFVFKDYSESIYEVFNKMYTPLQSSIKSNILNNEYFFFSAPTSSGKSFILKDLLFDCHDNAVVIVPSRALINEYVSDLYEGLYKANIKDFNVLQYVEKVNLKYTPKTIFVLTPERCMDLFKKEISVSLFIFDEAQLIDKKEGIRSLKYKMLVKKIDDKYKNSKKMFAYPFVENVECVVESELVTPKSFASARYEYKSVGQLFIEHDNEKNDFSLISPYKKIKKVKLNLNPIFEALSRGKTMLVYTSKKKIYNGKIYEFLKQYIQVCNLVDSPDAIDLIEKVRKHIGADENKFSELIDMMKYGVVIHHGSLPQEVRRFIEQFIRLGFCKICISTTTLLQGINMPFDIVYIYEWYNLTKTIDFKNLIGRAGRSTLDSKFDYGIIIVRDKNNLRKKSQEHVVINTDDYEPRSYEEADLKDAILSGNIDEETNLPVEIINKITTEDIYSIITELSVSFFDEEGKLNDIDSIDINDAIKKFGKVYERNLHNRHMTDVEYNIFFNAILIMIMKMFGFKFKEIVNARFNYAQKHNWNLAKADSLPNMTRIVINVFDENPNEKAYYDLVVYDTYEYIDKVVNICIKDVIIAAVLKTKNNNSNSRLESFFKYLQYYSNDNNEIALFKYGFDEDEIDEIIPHVYMASSECILFKKSIETVDSELYKKVKRYIYDDNTLD